MSTLEGVIWHRGSRAVNWAVGAVAPASARCVAEALLGTRFSLVP